MVAVQAQLGEFAGGREAIAANQIARFDEALQVGAELPVDRHSGGGIEFGPNLNHEPSLASLSANCQSKAVQFCNWWTPRYPADRIFSGNANPAFRDPAARRISCREKKNPDDMTQTLALPKDPPPVVIAETSKLVFHVSPFRGGVCFRSRHAMP